MFRPMLVVRGHVEQPIEFSPSCPSACVQPSRLPTMPLAQHSREPSGHSLGAGVTALPARAAP